jgi:SAM-dependent methyltransferase
VGRDLPPGPLGGGALSTGARIFPKLGRAYERLYALLCGELPGPVRPWHRAWLATVDLHRDLRRVLRALGGRVLDVGCGEQPYRDWFSPGAEYVGIDVEPRAGVAAVIDPGRPWPLESESFDAVICTQVLEHDSAPEHTLAEIERVLRPRGRAVITVPFAYNEHAMPHDYRRWSAVGAERWVGSRLDVVEVRKQGPAGAVIGSLWLNWIEHTVGRSRGLQILRALLLPLWIAYCGLVNLVARGIDSLDQTGALYSNVMVVARKSEGS